jgi:purine nucleoside phosphorylase
MEDKMSKIYEAADYLKSRLDGRVPIVGIILGSGLGKLGDKIEDPVVVPYKEIPNFAPFRPLSDTRATLLQACSEANSFVRCRGVSIIMKVTAWTRLLFLSV